MKAIRIHQHGGPEVLRYEDVADAPAPPGQVRVRVAAAGVNFIDTYQRSGLYTLPLPAILGQEGAGTIEEAGPGVTEFARGERVVWAGPQGAYAEIATVPADRAVRVPAGVDDRLAAALMLQGITAHYLAFDSYPIQESDWVVVHAAAGGVGLLLTQMAKLRGAHVIGTTSTEEKAALAREAGADEVLRYEGFADGARQMTGDAGVAAVYDGVGKTTFYEGLQAIRPFGKMILYGAASGQPDPLPVALLAKHGSLYVQRPTIKTYTRTPELLRERARRLFDLVEHGKLEVRIGARYPLAQARQAHVDLQARKTTGKILLIP